MRIGLGDVAHGDDRVGAVEEADAKDARLGAEGGERLLRPENGEQIAGARAAEWRPRLDISLGVGEQRIAPIAGRTLREAPGERSLPTFA